MEILFLTTILPSKKLHGSEIASQSIIDAFRFVGCNVVVIGYERQEDSITNFSKNEISVGQRTIETKQALPKAAFWFVKSLAKGTPYSSEKYFSKKYVDRVLSILSEKHFDLIVFDHPQIGWIEKYIDGQHFCLIAHNIEHEIYLQHAQSETKKFWQWVYIREAKKIKEFENKLAINALEVWTLTIHDSTYFSKLDYEIKTRTIDLPVGLSKPILGKVKKKFDIGIIGSWPWKANEEGLLWFLKNVYPKLPKDVSIKVAGRGADWLTDKYENVEYLGFVPSAHEFMAKARLVAIPILSGGGIQIKTLDAIASGSMIVATTVALRGITHPPNYIKVADDADEFADSISCSLEKLNDQVFIEESTSWLEDRRKKFISEIDDFIAKIM